MGHLTIDEIVDALETNRITEAEAIKLIRLRMEELSADKNRKEAIINETFIGEN